MGHNPSKNPFRLARISQSDQVAVDAYKARSVWGRWWQLEGDYRARYFNQDEIRWIKRYGSRCDQIACMTVEPRTEKEHHFLKVCLGHVAPETDRERLWLRVQMACRFAETVEKAAAFERTVETAAGLAAEVKQLRADMREMELDMADVHPGEWALQDALREANARIARLAELCGLANVVRIGAYTLPRYRLIVPMFGRRATAAMFRLPGPGS